MSEEDGATISSPSTLTDLIKAGAPGVATLNLNPLTLFIDQQATQDIQRNGTPLDTAIDNAKANVESVYGITTNPDKLVPDYSVSGIGTDAGNLGLVLGAIINADQLLCPNNPGGLATALADDLSDKVFDGKEFGVAISYCNSPLPPIAGTADFEDALSGIFSLQLTSRAFAFGGTNNELTNAGIMPTQLIASTGDINSAVVQAATVTNSMTAGPTMGASQDREGATATLLQNGLVLIAGGRSSSTGLRNDAVLYNSASNIFSTVTSTMTVPREFATATLLPNGKVLIARGTKSHGRHHPGDPDLGPL